jgi:probable F420-dependent oxidoreductase
MPERPFRFGLLCGAVHSRVKLAERLRKAEDDGFSTALFTDHFSGGLAPFAAMATAAAACGLRVGTLVAANDFRHPADLAREAATIDLLSEGRLELGIGTGWMRPDYAGSGIALDPPAQRVQRLEEAVAVLKGLWTGEEFSFNGVHYRVAMRGRPLPSQKPHPPLLIAGSGPRMLALAGREADTVGITATAGKDTAEDFRSALFSAGESLPRRLEWIREAASSRRQQPELNVLIHEAFGDAAAVENMANKAGVETAAILSSPHLLVGDRQQVMETLIERRERFGISYVAFASTIDVEAIAPVVRQLAGG